MYYAYYQLLIIAQGHFIFYKLNTLIYMIYFFILAAMAIYILMRIT